MLEYNKRHAWKNVNSLQFQKDFVFVEQIKLNCDNQRYKPRKKL